VVQAFDSRDAPATVEEGYIDIWYENGVAGSPPGGTVR
jgi:hypothetical protein